MPDRIAIARESTFGDYYLYHPECSQHLRHPDEGPAEEWPLSSIPPGRQWCIHCKYWLWEAGHPLKPKTDEQFIADTNAAAATEKARTTN